MRTGKKDTIRTENINPTTNRRRRNTPATFHRSTSMNIGRHSIDIVSNHCILSTINNYF